jgi:hypothetical protein
MKTPHLSRCPLQGLFVRGKTYEPAGTRLAVAGPSEAAKRQSGWDGVVGRFQ